MSRLVRDPITCPRCGQMSDFEHFASVNVTLDPELRERVFERTLSKFCCRGCKLEASVEHDLLYHDMSLGFMIQLDSQGRFDGEEFDRLTPLLAGSGAGPRLTRVVGGYNELLEKVLIFEAKLDDRLLEVLKVMLVARQPEIADASLFFDSVSAESFKLVALKGDMSGKLELPLSSLRELSSQPALAGRLVSQPSWGRVDREYALSMMQAN